jgi:integrase
LPAAASNGPHNRQLAIGRATASLVPLGAHECALPKEPIDACWVAVSPEREDVGQGLVGLGMGRVARDIPVPQRGRREASREPRAEREQFEAVRTALPAYLQPIVTFAYCTGWRVPSEVLTLEWRQVDFEAGTVRLDAGRTKNGEARVFPFTVELRALLVAQRAATDDVQRARGMVVRWVFHRNGERIRDFRGAWQTACEAAGVPGRIPHDFRRTAVRNLERAGVPRSVAMAMTGHKTEAVYRRYAIVAEGDLHEAARRLDAIGNTK